MKSPHPIERNKNYHVLKNQEKKRIMELKQQKISCREISKMLDINLKTIQSVKSSERKSEYKDYIETVIQYGTDHLLQVTSIQFMCEKKLKKLASKVIREVMLPQKTALFAEKIPAKKKNSNKRRIQKKIIPKILENIKIITEEKTKAKPPQSNIQTSRDENKINSPDSTNYFIIGFQNDQNNQYHEDSNCWIESTHQNLEPFSDMIYQLESSSIIFSNTDQFEKNLDLFSKEQ